MIKKSIIEKTTSPAKAIIPIEMYIRADVIMMVSIMF